jgi:hypothetical protein
MNEAAADHEFPGAAQHLQDSADLIESQSFGYLDRTIRSNACRAGLLRPANYESSQAIRSGLEHAKRLIVRKAGRQPPDGG